MWKLPKVILTINRKYLALTSDVYSLLTTSIFIFICIIQFQTLYFSEKVLLEDVGQTELPSLKEFLPLLSSCSVFSSLILFLPFTCHFCIITVSTHEHTWYSLQHGSAEILSWWGHRLGAWQVEVSRFVVTGECVAYSWSTGLWRRVKP